jgi:CheY-like chemotaxis protein
MLKLPALSDLLRLALDRGDSPMPAAAEPSDADRPGRCVVDADLRFVGANAAVCRLSSGEVAARRYTILLAEDDDSVRKLVREMLELHGFDVLAAANGLEALSLAEATSGPIHALVTDVVMPGLNGRQLAAELLRRLPATPVLYMSGYPDGSMLDFGSLEPGSAFLQKPFRLEALLVELERILDT